MYYNTQKKRRKKFCFDCVLLVLMMEENFAAYTHATFFLFSFLPVRNVKVSWLTREIHPSLTRFKVQRIPFQQQRQKKSLSEQKF
jgi:hypothetical protein